MAFSRAAGYNNLPTGAFTPVIYSQKVLKFLRTKAVVEDITNTDYAGEIQNFGDTVKVIKEPTVSVSAYVRGQVLNTQDLYDEETTMVIDKANYFQFRVDDLEERQSHINWEPLATSAAAYKLRDTYDAEVLTYMLTQPQSANILYTNAAPADLGFGTSEVDPVNAIAELARVMDEANVPYENRWLVARPKFFEQLAQSSSKVMDMSVVGSGESQLRNGMWHARPVHGFKMYVSNNLPNPSGSNATHYILAGHASSTATASQIAKTETIRDPDTFGDKVRGLHVYGRKTFRPECLALSYIKID
jgi:hypothetical protein